MGRHQAWPCPSVAAYPGQATIPAVLGSLSYAWKRVLPPSGHGTRLWLVCTWEAEVQEHQPRLSPQAGAKPPPVGREPHVRPECPLKGHHVEGRMKRHIYPKYTSSFVMCRQVHRRGGPAFPLQLPHFSRFPPRRPGHGWSWQQGSRTPLAGPVFPFGWTSPGSSQAGVWAAAPDAPHPPTGFGIKQRDVRPAGLFAGHGHLPPEGFKIMQHPICGLLRVPGASATVVPSCEIKRSLPVGIVSCGDERAMKVAATGRGVGCAPSATPRVLHF